MMWRFVGRLLASAGLLAGVWGLGAVADSPWHSWVQPVGAPRGPVRILRFYASTGSIAAGGTAQLCYGVENAKSVHISPAVDKVLPAANRCLEIVPERTTHYTIMAEGFDGHVVTRFVTLVVEPVPAPAQHGVNLAAIYGRGFSVVSRSSLGKVSTTISL